MKIAICK